MINSQNVNLLSQEEQQRQQLINAGKQMKENERAKKEAKLVSAQKSKEEAQCIISQKEKEITEAEQIIEQQKQIVTAASEEIKKQGPTLNSLVIKGQRKDPSDQSDITKISLFGLIKLVVDAETTLKEALQTMEEQKKVIDEKLVSEPITLQTTQATEQASKTIEEQSQIAGHATFDISACAEEALLRHRRIIAAFRSINGQAKIIHQANEIIEQQRQRIVTSKKDQKVQKSHICKAEADIKEAQFESNFDIFYRIVSPYANCNPLLSGHWNLHHQSIVRQYLDELFMHIGVGPTDPVEVASLTPEDLISGLLSRIVPKGINEEGLLVQLLAQFLLESTAQSQDKVQSLEETQSHIKQLIELAQQEYAQLHCASNPMPQ